MKVNSWSLFSYAAAVIVIMSTFCSLTKNVVEVIFPSASFNWLHSAFSRFFFLLKFAVSVGDVTWTSPELWGSLLTGDRVSAPCSQALEDPLDHHKYFSSSCILRNIEKLSDLFCFVQTCLCTELFFFVDLKGWRVNRFQRHWGHFTNRYRHVLK